MSTRKLAKFLKFIQSWIECHQFLMSFFIWDLNVSGVLYSVLENYILTIFLCLLKQAVWKRNLKSHILSFCFIASIGSLLWDILYTLVRILNYQICGCKYIQKRVGLWSVGNGYINVCIFMYLFMLNCYLLCVYFSFWNKMYEIISTIAFLIA